MSVENNKITTPVFRVCFPHVYKASASEEGGEPKFSLVGLFDNEDELKDMKRLAKAAAKEKWGDKIPKGLRSPFREGNEKSDKYPEFEGMIYVSFSSKQKPKVVDQDVEPILDESEFYAGCYARASIRAYAYDQKGNKGVAFGLFNVQKVDDGDPLGGGSDPNDDFEPVGGGKGKSADDDDGDFGDWD